MSQVRNNPPSSGSGVNNVAGPTAGYATTTSTYTPVPAPGTTGSNLAYTATQQAYGAPGTATYTTTQPAATTYTTTSNQQTTGVAQYGSTLNATTGQKPVAADIPVQSRIEYVPFEKKYTEYEQVEKVYQVPYETEVIEYEEVTRNERVPYERTITDYYAVETQVEYIKREVEETVMVEEPVEKTYERVQYIPVETQIVHYPERDNYVPGKTQTRTEYVGQVQGGQTYQTQGQTYQIQGQTYQTQGQAVQGQTYQSYSGVQQGSRGVVAGGSNAGQTTTTTTYGAPAASTTQTYQVSGYQAPPTTTNTTYQTTTGGYVTGGSGVRGGSGYVTGGSGVRGQNTTYVTSGSGVKGASYETNAGTAKY